MEAQQGSPMSMLFIFIIFGLIFYFMIYRPQAKRNKEHNKLMSELTVRITQRHRSVNRRRYHR